MSTLADLVPKEAFEDFMTQMLAFEQNKARKSKGKKQKGKNKTGKGKKSQGSTESGESNQEPDLIDFSGEKGRIEYGKIYSEALESRKARMTASELEALAERGDETNQIYSCSLRRARGSSWTTATRRSISTICHPRIDSDL
jgi:hypothetical protein